MSTCRASRTRLRRHRRRRWIARRSAFVSQAQPPRPIAPPIERNGIELRPDATGLQLSTLEYHAGPVHLTAQDLARCGLTPTGKNPWPESIAARWLDESKVRPDRTPRGPALSDPSWQYPPGLDTRPIHLTDRDLSSLALAWR